jgi:hypothetical protein
VGRSLRFRVFKFDSTGASVVNLYVFLLVQPGFAEELRLVGLPRHHGFGHIQESGFRHPVTKGKSASGFRTFVYSTFRYWARKLAIISWQPCATLMCTVACLPSDPASVWFQELAGFLLLVWALPRHPGLKTYPSADASRI